MNTPNSQQNETTEARADYLHGRVVFRRTAPFSPDERRLGRERFRGHHLTIGNHPWQKYQ